MPALKSLMTVCIFSLLVLVSSGCSSLPVSGPLPDNLVAERIGAIDESAPFAVSPDGSVVAYLDGGVKLLHLSTKERLEITTDRATQLAWSPLGSTLAASFYQDGKSRIVTFDSHGIQVAETLVEGRVTDIDWLSEYEIIAGSFLATDYKFGSNYKSILNRWQPGRSNPESKKLRDTTLRPGTAAKLRQFVDRGPMLALYPPGGQILYMHPSDPPLFTPNYRLVLRDLATDRELEIGALDFSSAGGKFSPDGETIVYPDGAGNTVFFSPWSEESLLTVKTPGTSLEVAPVGSYWFADGTLFLGAAAVTPLAPGTGKFSPNGRELFIASRGEFYRLTGLRPPEASGLQGDPEKILKLRSWKLEGLISAKEYRENMKKGGQP